MRSRSTGVDGVDGVDGADGVDGVVANVCMLCVVAVVCMVWAHDVRCNLCIACVVCAATTLPSPGSRAVGQVLWQVLQENLEASTYWAPIPTKFDFKLFPHSCG